MDEPDQVDYYASIHGLEGEATQSDDTLYRVEFDDGLVFHLVYEEELEFL